MTITGSFQQDGTMIVTISSQNFHFHFRYHGGATHYAQLGQCRCAELGEANKQEALRCCDCVDHILSLKALVCGHTETEAGGGGKGGMLRVLRALQTLVCCGHTRKIEAGGEENEGMLRVWKAQMQDLLSKVEDLLQEAFGVLLEVQEFRHGSM
ncbi:MAG: hypothetical protein Q9207_006916 [Kuettlingeria erythrocarpa]